MSEPTKTMNLPVTNCCATCVHMRGWLDNMWCGKHEIVVIAYTKCDDFERRPGLPVWVMCRDIRKNKPRRPHRTGAGASKVAG